MKMSVSWLNIDTLTMLIYMYLLSNHSTLKGLNMLAVDSVQ